MPQPSPPDRPDAGAEVILGIDTHKDVHAAVVISLLGVVLGRRCFPTTASGYETLLDWARGFGALRRAGVECTGSYGKALTRYLRAATGDITVIEVNKPDRAARRRRGKTDTVDAEAAARAVLSGQASATAKTSDGNVEMLRLFKLAKSSAIKSRTQTINQLKSVLIGADPDRMAHEASFAALCGTSPVEASSGKTSRRRLNRGGNRHANSALYMIVVTRLRWCHAPAPTCNAASPKGGPNARSSAA